MDEKTIQMLINAMNQGALTAVELSQGDQRIRLEKNSPAAPPASPAPQALFPVPAAAEIERQAVDFNHIQEIKSPMVGVFYAALSPDAPPLVSVGSKVKKGDVLCIIETMKMMNEILAETDGEIVDICVSNAEVVEYSQTLFKLC